MIDSNEVVWIGRNGGLKGSLLEEDIATGHWMKCLYEINRSAKKAPNKNWFRLEDFKRRISEAPERP